MLFAYILFIGLFLIARPLTVLFHELGHAIPAILLTKEKVSIYIGSFGDQDKNLKLSIGLLSVYFHYNLFAYKICGLCVPSAAKISVNRQIIYIAGGPLLSLIIGGLAGYFVLTHNLNGFLNFFLMIILISAFFDFYESIIPSSSPIQLHNGSTTFNDGQSLKELFQFRSLPKEYFEAAHLFNDLKYAEAAAIYDTLIEKGINNDNIYRFGLSSHLQCKNYSRAIELAEKFKQSTMINSDDFCNIGMTYTQLEKHDKAMEFYDKSLALNPDNKYSLNNKAYTLIVKNKFEDAIPLLDKAIELDKDFPYSYNNRGLARIRMGQLEEGLSDVKKSLELDPMNSYCYMNIGVYHMLKEEYQEAMLHLQKAKQIDATTYGIDELIRETEENLS